MDLVLRKLNDEDLLLIKKWLYTEHVHKWFEQPEEWLYEIKERFGEFSFLNHFIALYKQIPVGFCQYYKCREDDGEWNGDGTYSIDYLIGEIDYLRKGLGRIMITELIKKVFLLDDAKKIVVKPDYGNIPSHIVLLSCGFEFVKEKEFYMIENNNI